MLQTGLTKSQYMSSLNYDRDTIEPTALRDIRTAFSALKVDVMKGFEHTATRLDLLVCPLGYNRSQAEQPLTPDTPKAINNNDIRERSMVMMMQVES